MGLTISNNGIISMYRGDNVIVPLFINTGSKQFPKIYYPKINDTLYMSIGEPNQDFNSAVLRKVITLLPENMNEEGFINLSLSSSDTQNLKPGEYYLEIKVKLGNGNICTIMQKRKFFIFD